MRRLGAILGALALGLAIAPTALGAGPEAFDATLDGASEVPAVSTSATGYGWVAISSDETTVTYYVEYSGLSGSVSAAHIHVGAPGTAGPIVFPLAAGPSPMSGTLTAADFQAGSGLADFAAALDAIRNGETYINLHTAANPAGEIRGNLATAAEAFESSLDGAQEVPPVSTTATGSGLLVISSDESRLTYRVTYTGLSGPVGAAHIHLGDPGVAGGILFPLVAGPSPMVGTLTSADLQPTGSVTDYAGALAAIRAGGTYFNLHTAANPAGEIRGQIGAPAPEATPTPTPGQAPTPPATATAEIPASGVGLGPALVVLVGVFGLAFAVGGLAVRRRRSG
ncbi:MAG TPA: CHRD domain-containing protein [Candidatus Binatia bacterium]|nr:CHRD domain-containing protein [Candidatus Binatia bacterium]